MAISRPKRRLAADERRALILNAALEEFAGSDYDTVSMDKVAKASGVSKPVLYDHFPSKTAVYSAVLEGIREDLLERGRQASKLPDVSPAERVKLAISGFFSLCEADPAAMRVLLLRPSGPTEAEDIFRATQEVATQTISKLMRELDGGRSAVEAEAAAAFLKSGLHGLARWQMRRGDVDTRHLAEMAFQLIWSGLSHSSDTKVSAKRTARPRGRSAATPRGV